MLEAMFLRFTTFATTSQRVCVLGGAVVILDYLKLIGVGNFIGQFDKNVLRPMGQATVSG
jgi:hypothetical protein